MDPTPMECAKSTPRSPRLSTGFVKSRHRGLGAALVLLAIGFAAAPGCSRSSDGAGAKIALEADAAAKLAVTAHWDPITWFSVNANERFPNYFVYKTAVPEREYSGAEFAAFLPEERVAAGEIWPLDMERVLPFWRQFDPSATQKLHHGRTGEGAYAALRAYDDAAAEIVFRTHGEYSLNQGRVAYVPGQLSGRLLLDRRSGAVTYFNMFLPTDRSPNVVTDFNYEMEVEKNGKKELGRVFDADIVFVPRMELVGGATERPPDDTTWKVRVDGAALRREIQALFYESDRIEWLNVDEAALRSKESGKPIHLIAMFGVLDDESC